MNRHPGSWKNTPNLPLKLHRRPADHSAETRAEGPQAFVSDREANVGYRQPVAGQQVFGSVDPHARQKLMRRFAEHTREDSMVVKLRNPGLARRIRQPQRLIQPLR